MSLRGEDALILAYDYTEKSLEGAGALKGQDGKDGVSPIISVNTSTADTYKLDITDKNGTITTPNLVGKQGERGEVGETGADGETPTITENADNTEEVYKLDFTTKNGTFTTKNIIGKQGLEGVSPSVTTNPDNTAEDYRLNITTKGGTFTTPNLRGPQGERGMQGESAASAINPRGDYDVNADPHYTVSDYITSAEGNTYVCKKDNPNNVAPTDGTINDEFWQILALRGAQGIAGKDGEKGADGVTFTPSIDVNGVLSFTNNGGLENPEPIDIKGDNGVTFTPSIDADGYLSFTNNGNLENPEPIKVLGKDGVDGKDGIDGTTYIPSIGTVTTVESNADASAGVTVDEETKEAVFHFEIPKGEKGFSPIVETVKSENGHTVNITDVEGVKSFEVLNGKGIITSLEELGLTAPTTVGEVFMAMPNKSMAILSCEAKDEADGTITVSDIPVSYGVLIIKKNGVGRFSIEYQNSSYNASSNVKKWIGTLKGADGTGLKWQELATMDKVPESVVNPTELDTNKFLKSGYYSLGDARDRTNLPIQRVGTLLVFYAGYYVIQEYILNENQRAFMRKSIDKGANWSAWTELATMDKVNALHKETTGFITGSLLGSVVKDANLYYQKIGDNRLVINGWVSIDAVSARTPIFTLPNNWKANSNYLIPCYVIDSNVACACMIDIKKGTVNSYTPLPATLELRFCGEIYLM